LIRDEAIPPNVSEGLNKIHSSGDLLLGIINDILDLSKIEAGKLELNIDKYETASLINDTVTLNTMRIESKPIEFRLFVDENIPSFMVGDDLRIRQILNNLLSNAFKYTREGEVKLSFDIEKGSTEKGNADTDLTLVFNVSDTGLGMTEEQVNTLFDKFTRFNFAANRTTEGTGLGMNIVQNLVKLMDGDITVKSKLNVGTTITVRLPQGYIASGVLGKELTESLQNFQQYGVRQTQKARVVYESMSYGSILIVDDVESNLYVARGLMMPYGLSIDTATSGFEAIDKIKNGKVYDIVFMDHMMPTMDGLQATKMMRTHGYTQPIVALTANAVSGQRDMFLSNGFDDFISKPIDVRQLNDVLKKFVRNRQPSENPIIALPSIPPQLAEFFVKDASKVVTTLEMLLEKQELHRDREIKSYTTSVHGIKSALVCIGESELSAVAAKLEQAGHERDIDTILAETPAFVDKLRGMIESLSKRSDKV